MSEVQPISDDSLRLIRLYAASVKGLRTGHILDQLLAEVDRLRAELTELQQQPALLRIDPAAEISNEDRAKWEAAFEAAKHLPPVVLQPAERFEPEWGYQLYDHSGNSTPWTPLPTRMIAENMVAMKREQGGSARLGRRTVGAWRDVDATEAGHA